MIMAHPSEASAFPSLLERLQPFEEPVRKADSHPVVSCSLKAIEPERSRLTAHHAVVRLDQQSDRRIFDV
jgi:hypothetical protein